MSQNLQMLFIDPKIAGTQNLIKGALINSLNQALAIHHEPRLTAPPSIQIKDQARHIARAKHFIFNEKLSQCGIL